MVMEWDWEDIDPEEIGKGGWPADGRYHVQVDALSENGGKKGEMLVTFCVLAGTVSNQEGKTIIDHFYTSKAARDRIFGFAVAVGLTTWDELKTTIAAKKNPSIDFNLAVGRQCCIDVKGEDYQGKVTQKVGFTILSIEGGAAASIPILQDAATSAAAKAGDSPDPFGAPAGEGDSGGDDLFG